LRIEEVAEGNLGKSLIFLLSAASDPSKARQEHELYAEFLWAPRLWND